MLPVSRLIRTYSYISLGNCRNFSTAFCLLNLTCYLLPTSQLARKLPQDTTLLLLHATLSHLSSSSFHSSRARKKIIKVGVSYLEPGLAGLAGLAACLPGRPKLLKAMLACSVGYALDVVAKIYYTCSSSSSMLCSPVLDIAPPPSAAVLPINVE